VYAKSDAHWEYHGMDAGNYWSTETLIVIGIGIFVLFSLLGIVVWNKKSSIQVKTLKSIDVTLKEDQEISTEENKTDIGDETDAEGEKAEATAASGDPEADGQQNKENIGNVAKSGRAYTREELEQQIKC